MLDVQDYFPSCTENNVAHFFHKELKCARDVAAILTDLTTSGGSLPQGSPCSPILAYFSNILMWSEIAIIVEQAGCLLSVYVDDITISGKHVPGALIWEIKRIVRKHGLKLKAKKERSLTGSVAEVTGVVLRGDRTVVPNRSLKKLAELKLQRRQAVGLEDRIVLDRRIAGRRAQRKQVEC